MRGMRLHATPAVALLLLFAATLRADDDEPRPVGMRPTDWEAADFGGRREPVSALAGQYMEFISKNKTEREVVAAATRLAQEKGFTPAPERGAVSIRAGQRMIFSAHGKIAALVVGGN